MTKDQLRKYTEKIKKNVIEDESIPDRKEKKLVEEIENLQNLINISKEEDLQHFKQILERIDHIIKNNELNKRPQFLRSSLKELRESVKHLEESHPKIIEAIEQIINLFAGWGLV